MATRKRKRRKDEPPTPEMALLPQRLRAALKADGRTQKEIAESAGVDAGQVSQLKKGEQLRGVAADTLVRLAKELGRPPAFLIDGGGDEIPSTLVLRREELGDDWDEVILRFKQPLEMLKRSKPKASPTKKALDA